MAPSLLTTYRYSLPLTRRTTTEPYSRLLLRTFCARSAYSVKKFRGIGFIRILNGYQQFCKIVDNRASANWSSFFIVSVELELQLQRIRCSGIGVHIAMARGRRYLTTTRG